MEHERLVLLDQVGSVPGGDGGGGVGLGGDHGEGPFVGGAVSVGSADVRASGNGSSPPIVWYGVAGCLRWKTGQES